MCLNTVTPASAVAYKLMVGFLSRVLIRTMITIQHEILMMKKKITTQNPLIFLVLANLD